MVTESYQKAKTPQIKFDVFSYCLILVTDNKYSSHTHDVFLIYLADLEQAFK